MTQPPPHPATQRSPIPLGEFVALVAALMATGALGVDAMLPALPTIGHELGVANPNAPQFVIVIFLIGLGIGQLIHGPASDHFGRRPVMIVALGVYAAANLAVMVASSFALLLAARFVGAVAVAATRVVTIAAVRDCYSGRPMARVMSLAAMVFLIVPVLAPTLGQGILLIGSWRLIFAVILAVTLMVLAWFAVRLPETLDPAIRQPFSIGRALRGAGQALGDRWSLGYMLAATAMQGALFGYLTSVQQIVGVTFGAGGLLNIVFATAAGAMVVANVINARLVMRLGSRVLSQSALVVMIAVAVVGLALDGAGQETLVRFVVVQALISGCFSLANSNFSSLAMTNMGAIAGTASSVQGFVIVTGGALFGSVIGQAFAGTAVPLHLGVLAAGIVAFAIVAITERGRLFHPRLIARAEPPAVVRRWLPIDGQETVMGGHQVQSHGSGDDGFDEDGYDESQRAEILEATRDGPTDGVVLTDLDPDVDSDDDSETVEDLDMKDGEVGETDSTVTMTDDDIDEDDAQDDFDAGNDTEGDDEDLSDANAAALKP